MGGDVKNRRSGEKIFFLFFYFSMGPIDGAIHCNFFFLRKVPSHGPWR